MEQQDNDKNAAQNLMRQLINAGIIEQDTDHSILVNSQNGQQEFRLIGDN